MKRQQKSVSERAKAEEAADDFIARLSRANAQVLRAALKAGRPEKRKKATGYAAS